MNYRRLSDNDLADFAANVLDLLGGTKLDAIDPAVRTSLETAIGTLPADLDVQAQAAMATEGERKAVVSIKNTMRQQIIELMSQVRNSLIAGVAPKEQFDFCGFDYREPAIGTYQAQDPTELSGFGYSNGVNVIKFRGNNRNGSVMYEIWRRHGDTVDWAIYANTRRQSYTDTNVSPGMYCEYRVRAVASNSISNFSNSAVVYGAN
ncbi:MAG: hypothetical protein KF881_13385 [Acidobacteria bacterium]|nr:hypothetical protein [Acidobacteriota bacterium]